MYDMAGYLLGENVHRLTGPVRIVTDRAGVAMLIGRVVSVHRNDLRLEVEAERAKQGPLTAHRESMAHKRRE